MLIYAIITITLALIFYTIGVWSEKIQGKLKKSHLIIFWTGLIFDTIGTSLMTIIANDSLKISFHGITGLLAILLMIFHALWATTVLIKKDEKMQLKFHKFSLLVWLIWLVPFLSGMIFGIK